MRNWLRSEGETLGSLAQWTQLLPVPDIVKLTVSIMSVLALQQTLLSTCESWEHCNHEKPTLQPSTLLNATDEKGVMTVPRL